MNKVRTYVVVNELQQWRYLFVFYLVQNVVNQAERVESRVANMKPRSVVACAWPIQAYKAVGHGLQACKDAERNTLTLIIVMNALVHTWNLHLRTS